MKTKKLKRQAASKVEHRNYARATGKISCQHLSQ
jgi:hypothetical protein